MADDPYPEIARELVRSADGAWEKIVLKALIEPDWSRFETAAYADDGTKRSVWLKDTTRMHALFEQVQDITESLGGRPKWKNVVFTLSRDGTFDVEFED